MVNPSIVVIPISLPLRSSRRARSSGSSYTKKEIVSAQFIIRYVVPAKDRIDQTPITTVDVENDSHFQLILKIFENMGAEECLGQIQVMKTLYSRMEDVMLVDNETFSDFPTTNRSGERCKRCQSSLNALFRLAAKKILSREKIDDMFRIYPKKV